MIKVFTNEKLNNSNAYLLVHDEQKTGLLIDTANMEMDILSYIKENDIKLENIILTHGHYDHIKGVDTITREHPTVRIWIGKRDRKNLHNSFYNLSMIRKNVESWKMSFNPVLTPVNKVTEVKLSEFNVKIIPAPGHTPGSLFVVLPDQKMVFIGDTLFIKGDEELFGRHKLFQLECNPIKFNKTLSMLFNNYSDDWTLFPGHWEYGFTLETMPDEKEVH